PPSVDWRMLRRGREREYTKLEWMQRYAYTRGCRRGFVLRYFGDPAAMRHCGACDRCLAADAGLTAGAPRPRRSVTRYVRESLRRWRRGAVTSCGGSLPCPGADARPSAPGPHGAGDGRRLPCARAALERVEEASEAAVVVGEAVLAGDPHARLVRRAHHRCDRPHQRAGLRAERKELA